MSTSPPHLSESPPANPADNDLTKETALPVSCRVKLRKMPPIPNRWTTIEDEEGEESGQKVEGKEEQETPEDVSSSILQASSLGLNHIRTRSAPSPLRFPSLGGTSSNLSRDSVRADDGTNANPFSNTPLENVASTELGLDYSSDRNYSK